MGQSQIDIANRTRQRALERFIASLKPGRFEGELNLTWLGTVDGRRPKWRHNPLPGKKRFRFIAADGTVIQPGKFETDFGSIPEAAWSINLNPCAYAAYILHDWLFKQHHAANNKKNFPCSFELANKLLAEGIYTQMVVGFGPDLVKARRDFETLYNVFKAVQLGGRIWNAQ